MGTQFWWFYDIIVAAVVLVCMFVSGRKGAMNAITTFVAYILAAGIAISVSAGISSALAGSTIKDSNVKKLENTLGETKFTAEVGSYIEGLEYGVKVDKKKLDLIYNGNKSYDDEIFKYVNTKKGKKVEEDPQKFYDKLHEGYAQIMKKIVAADMNKYASEYAAKQVREHPDKFNNIIPLLIDKESKTPAAKKIADEYTQEPYNRITRLLTFIILFVLLLAIALYLTHTMLGNGYHAMTLPAHVGGALIGIPKGFVLCFAAAVAVRLFVLLGSDEMLFFNFKAVDQTYIFKYLYNYVADNM